MARKIGFSLGVLLIVVGLLALLAAVALPWARYRVDADVTLSGSTVQQAPSDWVYGVRHGWWYLGVLAVVITLLAGALAGEPRWRPACGGLALLAGLAGTGLALSIAAQVSSSSRATSALGFADVAVHAQAGSGASFGALATALLGLGASVASLAGDRSRTAEPTAAPV
jgi:hypothetical protein